jgi:hypothetical protein
MQDDWYDVAQICLNGHITNSSTKLRPQHNKKFCDSCGASTIMNCPNCDSEIQGAYHMQMVVGTFFSLPSYCQNCGKPYPWTEKRLSAAYELAQELDVLSDEDKKILSQSIDDLIKETPKTVVASVRFKKIMAKAGKSAADGFKNILVDIFSEAVRKSLWPGES